MSGMVSLIFFEPNEPPSTSRFLTSVTIFFDFGSNKIGFPVVIALASLLKEFSNA